jgi:hypothetical protein
VLPRRPLFDFELGLTLAAHDDDLARVAGDLSPALERGDASAECTQKTRSNGRATRHSSSGELLLACFT